MFNSILYELTAKLNENIYGRFEELKDVISSTKLSMANDILDDLYSSLEYPDWKAIKELEFDVKKLNAENMFVYDNKTQLNENLKKLNEIVWLLKDNKVLFQLLQFKQLRFNKII